MCQISFSSNPHHRLISFMLFEIAALLSGQKDDAKNLTRMTVCATNGAGFVTFTYDLIPAQSLPEPGPPSANTSGAVRNDARG